MSSNQTSFRLPTAYDIPEQIEHKGEKLPVPPQIRQNVRMLFNGLLDAHQAIVKLKAQLGAVNPGTTVINNNTTNVTTGGTNPQFTTAGQGYFFSAGLFLPIAAIPRTLGSSWCPTPNKVNIVQFTVPFGVTFQVSTFSIVVAANSIGDSAAFAIYSADGNTKIIDSGPMSLSAIATVRSTVAAVNLVGGVTYNWAQTGTTNTATLIVTTSLSTNDSNLMNANAGAPRIAVAANTSAGAVMPATLGALTAVSPGTSFDMALVMLEP